MQQRPPRRRGWVVTVVAVLAALGGLSMLSAGDAGARLSAAPATARRERFKRVAVGALHSPSPLPPPPPSPSATSEPSPAALLPPPPPVATAASPTPAAAAAAASPVAAADADAARAALEAHGDVDASLPPELRVGWTELPGVPLVLRRLAAAAGGASTAGGAPWPVRPLPTLPPPRRAGVAPLRSYVACDGDRSPHTRRCRLVDVCLRGGGGGGGPRAVPRWVFFTGPDGGVPPPPPRGRGRAHAQSRAPCLPLEGSSPDVLCHGDTLAWGGSLAEGHMALVVNVTAGRPPPPSADADSALWYDGPVLALHRHDTGSVAHTAADDLFPLFNLGRSAWGRDFWGTGSRRRSAVTTGAKDAETWPRDRSQRAVVWLDAGTGAFTGAYTAQHLPGVPVRVRAAAALAAPEHAQRYGGLACFRDVAVGAGGGALTRGAGTAWDASWTASNDDDEGDGGEGGGGGGGFDRAAFLAASRAWVDHARAVAHQPSLRDAVERRRLQVAGGGGGAAAQRTILVVNRPPHKGRHLANAAELVAGLRAVAGGREVRVVAWDGMGAARMAKVVSHADVVVSVHGAGNINLQYAVPGSTLWVELLPEGCASAGTYYESLARRAGVAWAHLPLTRAGVSPSPGGCGDTAPPVLEPCAAVLAQSDVTYAVDVAAVAQLVAVALAPRSKGVVYDHAAVLALLPQALEATAAALRRLLEAGGAAATGSAGWPVRPLPPDDASDAAARPPRVVLFAPARRGPAAAAHLPLRNVAVVAGMLTSHLARTRQTASIPWGPAPGCEGDGDGDGGDDPPAGCFAPEGLPSQHPAAPLQGGRLLVIDDGSGGDGDGSGAAVIDADRLRAWLAAVRGAEVVIAAAGSPASALLPLAPVGADWVALVPPRDGGGGGAALAPAAAAAGVALHVHPLLDSGREGDRDGEGNPECRGHAARAYAIDAPALAAKVALLLGAEL